MYSRMLLYLVGVAVSLYRCYRGNRWCWWLLSVVVVPLSEGNCSLPKNKDALDKQINKLHIEVFPLCSSPTEYRYP